MDCEAVEDGLALSALVRADPASPALVILDAHMARSSLPLHLTMHAFIAADSRLSSRHQWQLE